MATTVPTDTKAATYDEKAPSPISPAGSATHEHEPVKTGEVSGIRRRLPGGLKKFSWEVRQEESSFATTKKASNADFDPIPPSKRTWGSGAYVAYWMADAWAVSNWEVGEYCLFLAFCDTWSGG